MEVLSASFILILFAFLVWVHVRILHKAGYSGWWVLLLFLPVVNVIMIWVFAFAEWPSLKSTSH